jgi:cytochrome c553
MKGACSAAKTVSKFGREFRLIPAPRHLAPPDRLRHVLVFPARGRVTGARATRNNGSVNMIHHRIPTVFAVFVAVAASGAPARAVEHAVEVPAVATPGNTAEATAFLNAKLLVCNTCHGPDGMPRSAPTPVIWGQQENYLVKQMHDFVKGDRDSEVMAWMATALTQPEIESAAAFFSKKSWPAKSAAPAAPAAPSQPPIAAICQACHGQNFVGGLAAPRLAGQTFGYLVETMRRYADGERKNNTDMMRMMEAITPAEREAIARYISSL